MEHKFSPSLSLFNPDLTSASIHKPSFAPHLRGSFCPMSKPSEKSAKHNIVSSLNLRVFLPCILTYPHKHEVMQNKY